MLRDEPMLAEEAEKRIKYYKKYRLPESCKIPKNMTWSQFVEKYITDWHISYSTIYAHNKNQQCRPGANRSVGDITKITQFYFPNDEVTVVKVRNLLKELVRERKITTSVCGTIKKRVFRAAPGDSGQVYHEDKRDEFGWRFDPNKIIKPKKKKSSHE